MGTVLVVEQAKDTLPKSISSYYSLLRNNAKVTFRGFMEKYVDIDLSGGQCTSKYAYL